jgi:hypothetical protein
MKDDERNQRADEFLHRVTNGVAGFGRQGTANPYACICGYEGSSQQDITEHCIASAPLDAEGTHAQVRTR